MKNAFIPPLLAALFTCSLEAAPPKKPDGKPAAAEPKAPAAETVDFAKFKTADEFWDYIVKVGAETPPNAKSRDDFMQTLQSWLTRQQTAADAFLKKYPDDARRWDAKVVLLMTATQLQNFGGKPLDPAAGMKELEAILAAPDATPGAKMEAAYLHVQLIGQISDTDKPETLARLEKAVASFLSAYPDGKRAPEIAQMQMQLIQMGAVPDADAALKNLAASKNEQIAAMAKSAIERKGKTETDSPTPEGKAGSKK